MRFGYMIDSPEYNAHYLGPILGSWSEAIRLLEANVPVSVFHRAGHPDADFFVELWEDKGIARKDMSFDDLKDVYRLYPTRAGYLVCNELTEHLWDELQKPGVTTEIRGVSCLTNEWYGFQRGTSRTEVEQWLGKHHSMGLSYLRYGELGVRLGEQRLAEIGRQLMENVDSIAEHPSLSLSNLCNLTGITREDAINASLITSSDPYFTVHGWRDTLLNGAKEWYSNIEEALQALRENMSHADLALYMNDEVEIGAVVEGEWHAAPVVSRGFSPAVQDAFAAFQAAKFSLDKKTPHYDRLFFTVGTGQTPPTDFALEYMDEARSLNIYDMYSAVWAFSNFDSPSGKTLYASFGRNVAGQCNLHHIPLMTQNQEMFHFLDTEPLPGHVLDMVSPVLQECLALAFPDNDLQVGRWGVKLIQPGDNYGLGNSLINDSGQVLVEFYDRSQDPARFPGGQFVSRYYADTLLGRDRWGGDCRNGLCLDGSVPSWTVSGEDMRPILNWLKVKADQSVPQRKPSLDEQMKAAQQRQTNNQSINGDMRKETTHERA